MRRLIDTLFMALIVAGCLGLDFYIQKRDHAGESFGVAEYIALRKDELNDLMNPPSLEAALPTQIAGWSVTKSGADQMVNPTEADRSAQASEIALVKAVASLAKASAPQGQMVGMTMTKGDVRLRMVAMLVQDSASAPLPAMPAAPGSPADVAALQSMMQALPPPVSMANYDVVDGVGFAELPAGQITGDPDMRMLRAGLTDALSVTVVTRSDDDAAIKEALQGIDFVMLNKLLNTPVAGVQDGRMTDLRQDPANAVLAALPASDLPQPPTSPFAPKTADKAGEIAPAQLAAPNLAAPNLGPAPQQPQAGAPKIAPAETAVFVQPPSDTNGASSQPCVRRAGVLVCPQTP